MVSMELLFFLKKPSLQYSYPFMVDSGLPLFFSYSFRIHRFYFTFIRVLNIALKNNKNMLNIWFILRDLWCSFCTNFIVYELLIILLFLSVPTLVLISRLVTIKTISFSKTSKTNSNTPKIESQIWCCKQLLAFCVLYGY